MEKTIKKKKAQAEEVKPWYRQKSLWAGAAIVLNGALGGLAIQWPHVTQYMLIVDTIFIGFAVMFLRMSQAKIESEILKRGIQ